MTTNGGFWFVVNGTYKEMYVHADAHKDRLGLNVVRAIRGVPLHRLVTIARGIKLVDAETRPTAAEVVTHERYSDRSGSPNLSGWCWLLRNAQSDVSAYIDGGLRVMVNGGQPHTSRDGGYVYLVDVDNACLLVHEWGRLTTTIDLDILAVIDDDAFLDVVDPTVDDDLLF